MNINIQMPTPEEIDAAFEQFNAAVAARFAQVEKLAGQFSLQAAALTFSSGKTAAT